MSREAPETGIDKSTWGPGPWQDEPDRLEGRVLGFPTLVVRVPESGHLCGYVAVPPGHPWHGKGYDQVEAEAHGGLTYADACAGRICHVPAPGEPDDVWWLGFDCAHCDDLSPGAYRSSLFHTPMSRRAVYRDVSFVQRQLERLARQAKAAAEGA